MCKLCLGVVLIFTPIFSFSATLPSGYTELEYIESTGTQVIDTGFVYNNNTRVIWDVQLTATLPLSDYQGFGVGFVQNNTERLGFSFEASNQKILLFKAKAVTNPDTRLQTINVDNNRHIIEINSPNNKGYVDGVEYTFDSSVGTTDNVTNATLPLFCWYSNIDGIKQYSHYSEAKLYSVKIYDNGTLVRDFVPAKRNSDGVVGLYDTVNNVFYTNSGTGSFFAGPAVNDPVVVAPCGSYTELEYIESSGTQIIDTGFVYDNNTRVIWDMQMTTQLPLSANNNSGVGYVNTDYERLGLSFNNSTLNLYKAYSTGNTVLPTINTDNNRHVIEINSPVNKAYVDGIEYTFNSAVGNINNNHNLTLPLFAWLGNTGYREYFTGRMYSVKIYDNGTLARNMVPARNSDGVVGLCDTVNDKFYTNAGTGTFTAGPAVSSCGYTELEYLELQGEAYFNTNVYLSKDMDIEFEFMPTQLSVAGTVIGVRAVNTPGSGFDLFYNINHPNNATNTLIDFFGADNSTGRWAIKSDGLDYVLVNNKKYKLSIVNKVGTFSADGVVIDTHTYTAPGTSPITIPLYIHTCNNAGNVGGTNDTIRFYHFSATGVADIVPVKRDCDNVLGLYNKTTGEFLEKIGSGTLVAGPAVAQPTTVEIIWGGLAEPDASGMCVYGETFTVPSTIPTADAGYKFIGWMLRQ